MTDTDTDALVEAMAKAVRLARLLRRGYEPSEAESIVEADPSTADEINSARALLPIITAHTAAAVAAETARFTEALRACRQATLHGAPEPRQNVREIVEAILYPETRS